MHIQNIVNVSGIAIIANTEKIVAIVHPAGGGVIIFIVLYSFFNVYIITVSNNIVIIISFDIYAFFFSCF